MIARSEIGIERQACESLGTLPQVVEAGSIGLDPDPVTVRPGIAATRALISPGLTRLLAGPRTDHDAPQELIYGTELAARLGLPARNDEARVLADRGTRTESVSGWILTPVSPQGRATECWVESTPGSFSLSSDVISARLLPFSSDLSVADALFDSGPRAFNPTGAVVATSTAVVTSLIFVALMVRFRRADLAMYRALGFSPWQAAAPVFIEVAVAAISAVAVGVLAWVAISPAEAILRPVIMLAQGLQLAMLATVSISAVVAIRRLSRINSVLSTIREGG